MNLQNVNFALIFFQEAGFRLQI